MWFVGGPTLFGQPAAEASSASEAEAQKEPHYDKSQLIEFGWNCRSETDRGDPALVGRLQRDLANSYYWSGKCGVDYIFFICNWHPLLGFFFCHPAHPWTKLARLGTFCLSVALSMLPSALLLAVEKAERDDVYWISGVAIFFAVTVPVMIWEIALYWVNISDSFCKGRCNFALPIAFCVKRCCFGASLAVAAVFVLISMLIMRASETSAYKVFLPVASARIQSWLVWFPVWTLLPYLGFAHCWSTERRKANLVHAENG